MSTTLYDLHRFTILFLLSSVLLHHLSGAALNQSNPRCHEDDRSALIEFKQSLMNTSCNSYSICTEFQKLDTWTVDKELNDCCKWEGISCDETTGRVIILDLSKTCACASSINSGSSLVRLIHLQYLNLATVDFQNTPAIVTSIISNLSSTLRSLDLWNCKLKGELSIAVFETLPKLEHLDLSYNEQLSGHFFPDYFNRSSNSLTELSLASTNFSGDLPAYLPESLSRLDISWCTFQGLIPSSVSNLTKLTFLDLGQNNFHGKIPTLSAAGLEVLALNHNFFDDEIPSSIGNLTGLSQLYLDGNQLTGPIPSSLTDLTLLQILDLSVNQLTGPIPHSIDNLKNLSWLHLGSNKLNGSIPSQLGNLTQLEKLYLFSNRLTGPVPVTVIARLTKLTRLSLPWNNLNGQIRFDFFLHNFPNLTVLDLSFNELSVIFDEPKPDIIHQYNKFTDLRLGSCNLSEFPRIFESRDWQLTTLDLSYNNLSGRIPTWFLSVSSTSLSALFLQGNSLTGFSQYPVFFNWTSLYFLNLRSNSLSGEIPPLLCNLSNIQRLDLGNNNFIGVIPLCLVNLSSNQLSILSLRGNQLSGHIPDHLGSNNRACSLKMIDVSDNQLQGLLPRSLSSCTELQFLNLRSNGIVDAFPSWLGSLPNLRVLILSSNRFHGAIAEPKDGYLFPKLHVFDISHNNFSSFLPSKYFENWNDATRLDGDEYIGEFTVNNGTFKEYDYSMTIINKGMEMDYSKILNYFIAIDLSGNNFGGEIPESFGKVKGLRLLNLSNNLLTGHIPAVLKDLTHLEALDLSRNDLSGDIPQQLTQLSFLSFFNVSYNRLSGLIPRGKQFNTFRNDSYVGNLGLCGEPLSEECGGGRTIPPYEEADGSYFELEWPIVLMGVVSGLIVGVVMGLVVPIRRNNWFVWKISEFVRARLAR